MSRVHIIYLKHTHYDAPILGIVEMKKSVLHFRTHLVLYLLTEDKQLVSGMRMTEINAVFKTQ